MDRNQSPTKRGMFDKGEEDDCAGESWPKETLSSIREMARDFGVSVRALRFYEDRGLLSPARKGTTRYYDATDRHHLQLILKGKRLGFTLTEIHDMLRGDEAKPARELKLMPEQIIAQISHLERQQSELEEALAALRRVHQKLTESACRFSTP